ncbi:hypothetical protein BDV95DRAFT_535306 [Massariosphaeria phaeospora]|uniref:N-acetyltransferase domain-containing protein n=1 Tax=Massariosphaeria phaeospora TaxID=100035 RepID=A0A7C8IQB4_9PLEO|nr:hypothetical protein BDV95DRAFT_535306 [Massariosphaeria phaeospora]
MGLQLQSITDSDFQEFVPALFNAMGGYSQFVNALYPGNLSEEGQQKAIQRFIIQKKLDKSLRWCKVTDTELGEIIGVAQWSVILDEKPQEEDIDGPPGTWENDIEKEYCQEIYRSFMENRRRIVRDNSLPIICHSCTQSPGAYL